MGATKTWGRTKKSQNLAFFKAQFRHVVNYLHFPFFDMLIIHM